MGHILLKFTLDQIKPLNLIPSLQERQRIVKQVKQPTKPQRETFCKTGAPDCSNSAIFKKAGTLFYKVLHFQKGRDSVLLQSKAAHDPQLASRSGKKEIAMRDILELGKCERRRDVSGDY